MTVKTADGPILLPDTARLANGKNFAAVSTVLPDGRVQTQMIWVHTEDGALVLNTEAHRAKFHNLRRDPKVTVLIRDEQDPYHYAEVRGHVVETVRGDAARAHIDELARKYTGGPYPPGNIRSERVLLKITPDRQTVVDQRHGVAD
ncbi:PPOX class F420-dependent oxidoreductase [Pseudonocardia eucalypti]|uniref:PPOX class F420-dependent oxidoreductase n=1 Tax=Pseudonocardia eucalypti TaxID=648755 RepID=A0ABP9PWW4_9PSEU|nr:PPOX class probable F420-dependent enzyme [Pseudonocardia eucalypti]